jgi:hypothetical protein
MGKIREQQAGGVGENDDSKRTFHGLPVFKNFPAKPEQQ